MTDKKAELKISEEEPEQVEEETAEKAEQEIEEETKTKKKGRPKKTQEETETPETSELDIILANHEERLRAIESWIFRVKSQ